MFDESGIENMWWTKRTIEEYEKRVDCFISHYESYSIPGVETKVNFIPTKQIISIFVI